MTLPSIGEARALARDLAHASVWLSGALAIRHRIVNGDTLTVFGAHRVLARDDPRMPFAMPTWTISDRLFEGLLAFIGKHYRVVSLDDVLDALQGRRPLPRRAALITFDDGFADVADTAMPILARMGLPSVLFIISGLVGSRLGTWESEWYAALQLAPDGELEAIRARELPGTKADLRGEEGVGLLCRSLRRLPVAERFSLLARTLARPDALSGDMMISEAQLRQLPASGCAIGAHSVSHDPLVGHPNALDEMRDSINQLQQLLVTDGHRVRTFSFPHGSYDARLVQAAGSVGAEACFTSDIALTRAVGRSSRRSALGRVWMGQALAANDGSLSSWRAAWQYLLAPSQVQA